MFEFDKCPEALLAPCARGRIVASLFKRKRLPVDGASVDDAVGKAAADRLRSNPRDLDALAAMGTYLLARGQADKALDCFHQITRAEPKYPGIWRLKAKAFEALGDATNADACSRRGADPRSWAHKGGSDRTQTCSLVSAKSS